MLAINRIENEASREKEETINVPLPFACNQRGFYDPLRANAGDPNDQQTYEFDVFPLPNQVQVANGPAPSTKFLHLSLEELHTTKIEQSPISRSRFPPTPEQAAAEQRGQRRPRAPNDTGDNPAAGAQARDYEPMRVEPDDGAARGSPGGRPSSSSLRQSLVDSGLQMLGGFQSGQGRQR